MSRNYKSWGGTRYTHGVWRKLGITYEQQGYLPSACAYYHRALAAERALDPPNPERLQIFQAALQRANCDQQNPQ